MRCKFFFYFGIYFKKLKQQYYSNDFLPELFSNFNNWLDFKIQF
jgi:hypothetical protein